MTTKQKPAAGPAKKQTATKAGPATKQPAKGTEPAIEAAEEDEGITLADLASRLKRGEKSVRAAIRRINGGAVVGRGGRYRWTSWDDEDLVALLGKLEKQTASTDA